jgi:hypothetical protein
LFSACDKPEDEPNGNGNDNGTVVEANGLTPDINNFISSEILAEIENLGMPINRGGSPPKNITGTYVSSQDICVATNRPNDEFGPGYRFADFYFIFSEQDNTNLTIKAQSAQSTHTGEGTGAYIVGNDNKFTVFCPSDMKTGSGHTYKSVLIYSGTLVSGGIKDFYHSTFMLEGGGAEWNLLENGQGRVIYDSDGLAEKKPDANVPGAITYFTATAGNAQVVLTWGSPSTNGGLPVTGYEVTMDNWATKVSKTTNDNTHTFTGLTNGTQYTFKIRALNAKGAGAEKTVTATPDAPQLDQNLILPEGQVWAKMNNSGYYDGYSFKADGTYGYYWGTWTLTSSGTWSTNGNKLTIIQTGSSPQNHTYTVSSSTFTMRNAFGDEYVYQKMATPN